MPDGTVIRSEADAEAWAAAHPPPPAVGPPTDYDPDLPPPRVVPRMILKG